jgi:Fe-S-cluster containining protein
MVGGELVFRCLRCGRCCKDLLAEDKGVLRGLTLMPDERWLFPESKVRPAVGVGSSPSGRDFEVITYQLTEDTCPRLNGNICDVYTERPSSCRQFPFSLRLGTGGELLMGFDLNCSSIRELLGSLAEPKVRFEEREHAERLLRVEVEAMRKPDRAWYFDLGSKKWVKYSYLQKG